jgi:hypothetical protein
MARGRDEEGLQMRQHAAGGRVCPKCGGGDYLFRGRTTVAPQPCQEGGAVVETKYACKGCGHEWRNRTEAKAA